MNQILSFEEKGVGSSASKTIRFFAISMMVFGAILLGEGGYSLAQNRKVQTSEVSTVEEAESIKPEISFEQNNSKLTVKIDGKAEISKVTYRWNDETEKTLSDISGVQDIEREIDIPKGTNDLTIKVIYANAKNFPFEKTESFTSSSTKIALSVIGNQIKMSIDDTKGIDYISYRWNEENEVTEKPPVDDNKNMEVLTDIPVGLNTLTVTAINMFGEESVKTQEVKGVKVPFINATWNENDILTIFVSASESIENVEFTINGNSYALNFADFLSQGYTVEQLNETPGLNLEVNNSGSITSLTYDFQLEEGMQSLDVEIKAESKNANESVSGTLARPQ